jgi:hypothetical protein
MISKVAFTSSIQSKAIDDSKFQAKAQIKNKKAWPISITINPSVSCNSTRLDYSLQNSSGEENGSLNQPAVASLDLSPTITSRRIVSNLPVTGPPGSD